MKKICLYIGIFVLAVHLIYLSLDAQTNTQSWQSLDGPWYAIYANDISIGYCGSQRIIYVSDSSANSLLKSTNEGESWIHLPVPNPLAVACVPHKPDTVYVGRDGQGIWKSTNGGTSFFPINTNFTNLFPIKIAISPHDENVVYVGCDRYGSQPILFRTQNGGSDWEMVCPFNVYRLNVTGIVFDPLNEKRIWISGYGYDENSTGVWRSVDGGNTWFRKIEGMDIPSIGALIGDPQEPDVLYAGGRWQRIYKTVDAGDRWEIVYQVGGNESFTVGGISIDKTYPQQIYVATTTRGVLKSTDGGSNWQSYNNGIYDTYALSVITDNYLSGVVYLGTYASIYRSSDGGALWEERTRGAEKSRTRDITVSGGRIFTVSSNPPGLPSSVINNSTDGGKSWCVLHTNSSYLETQYDGFDGRTISLGGLENDVVLAGGSLLPEWQTILSSKVGLDWKIVFNRWNIDYPYVSEIEFDQSAPNIAFAATDRRTFHSWSIIFRSTDTGASWAGMYTSQNHDAYCVEFDRNSGSPSQVIYAGGTFGVIKSTNGGNAWAPTGFNLTTYSLVVNPASPSILYAGTSSGIYKTTDGGTNWSFLSNSPLSKIDWLLVHPITANTIYAVATNDRKVYKSVDAGENWNEVSYGLPNIAIHRVRLDPTSPNIIYAATDSGVYSIPHIWTGEIAANATWKSGETYLVEGNLTIPEGKTLTIEPGTNVKFDKGAALYAYGTLRAEGSPLNPIVFEKTSEKKWLGIIIHNPDNSIIKHCKISGAQYGVAYVGLEDKIYPSLSNSEIRDCTEGIRLYGNIQYKIDHPIKQNLIENCVYGIVVNNTDAEYPSRGENRPRIDSNTVKNCYKNGIWAARSRPVFYHNQIINSYNEGVILTDGGNAEFGQKRTPGYNTISNNANWQVSVSYSNPLIGLVDDEKLCNPIAGGLNRIFHNSDEVGRVKAIGGGTVVQADKTLWGWPINPRWFEDDGKAIIIARCPIDPQGPREEELLIAAASKRAEGLYEQAIAAYDSLVEFYPTTTQAAAAVSGCADTYSEYAAATGDTSLNQAKIDYLVEQAEYHTNPDVKVVANLYLAREYEYKSEWQAAKNIYTEIIQNNPEAELKAIIYRALVNLNARGLKDFDAANQIIVNMTNEIPGNNHIEISRLDLALFTGEMVQISGSGYSKSSAGFKNKSGSNVPSRYSLEQNFPNPFNPSTEIWFKLGDDSSIKLKLYDILGKEIKTLASGFYPNGYHRVILDAADISSGVYTYRLEATSTDDPSRNFLQVRKMLLIK